MPERDGVERVTCGVLNLVPAEARCSDVREDDRCRAAGEVYGEAVACVVRSARRGEGGRGERACTKAMDTPESTAVTVAVTVVIVPVVCC